MKEVTKITLLAVLILHTSGCALPISQSELENGTTAIGKLAVSETFSIMIPPIAFYAKNNRWPNAIDELRSFAETSPEEIKKLGEKESPFGMKILPLDCSRFDNAEFKTLSSGDLKITLQEYTYEDGLTVGEMSFTVSPEKMSGQGDI